jgi:hypothetical protein
MCRTGNVTLIDDARRMVMWLAQDFRIGQKIRAFIDAPAKLEAVVKPTKA